MLVCTSCPTWFPSWDQIQAYAYDVGVLWEYQMLDDYMFFLKNIKFQNQTHAGMTGGRRYLVDQIWYKV